MASYLKFDGIDDKATFTFASEITDFSTLVYTAFVRFIQFPRWLAPVIRVSDNTGLWLRGNDGVTPESLLAMQLSVDVGDVQNRTFRTSTGMVPTSGATLPFRLGQMYKLQLVVAFDVTINATKLAFCVDGVNIKQITTSGAGNPMNPWRLEVGSKFCLGGITETATDIYSTDATIRAAQMDVIQAKWEVDRTVAFGSTAIDNLTPPDANSDPFTAMTLDGSATEGGLYLLNEGTGSTAADSSGNGHDLTISGATWAPAGDPSLPSAGVARWTFGSVEGYALRHTDAPDVVHQPIFSYSGTSDPTAGELRLRMKPPQWWEDGHAVTDWAVSTGLAPSTTQSAESGSSLRANNATAVTDRDTGVFNFPGSGALRLRMRARFYDMNGSDSGRLQRFSFLNSIGGVDIAVGVHRAQSTTKYMTFITGPGNVASSVNLSAGEHEFCIYLSADTVGAAFAIRMYVDGSLERTDAATNNSTMFAQLGLRQAATGSNGDGYWDLWQCNSNANAEYDGLVASTGSLLLPRFQPSSGVAHFKSVTITEATAGINTSERGTTLYEFRHSKDGGGSFSSFVTLTNAALLGLQCAGNGQDVLELRVTQTSAMDEMGSPATRQIDISYEPAAFVPTADEGGRAERHEFAAAAPNEAELHLV